MIVNDTSTAVRMKPQLGVSLTVLILMTLNVSFMLLDLSIMLLETFILQVSHLMIIIYVHLVLIVHPLAVNIIIYI